MIHWHEGLHLLPQHLQALQKFALDRMSEERPFLHRFPSGIIDLELDITKSTVGIKRLRAVMDSGVHLDYPRNVEIAARDVSPELARRRDGFVLRLGLPVWSAHRPNAFPMNQPSGSMARLRYRLDQVSLSDENVGGEGRATYIRKFNGRLLFESDDDADMEVLPLARIEPLAGTGFPRVDERYSPPLLRLKGWQPLYDLLRKAANEIEFSRGSLLGRLGEGGFDIQKLHGNQLAILLKLRTVNEHLSRLKSFLEVDQVSPFEVYCELQSMLGALAALDPLTTTFDAVAFAHNSPQDQFRDLTQKIAKLLEPSATTLFRRFPFLPREDGAYHEAQFDAGSILPTTAAHLCVELKSVAGRPDPSLSEVTTTVADRFIVTEVGQAMKGFSGLVLNRRDAPRGLPAHANLHYFDIDPTSEKEIWSSICTTRKMALRFSRVSFGVESIAVYLS